MSTHLDTEQGMYTKMIHAGQRTDPVTMAVAPPIYQTSTFAFRNTRHGADCFCGKDEVW